MRFNLPSRSRLSWALPGLFLAATAMGPLAGCGTQEPPFDELPLRDALQADPEAIAAMPDEARRELAERLIDEQPLAGEPATPAESALPSVSSLVMSADEAREAEGKDAVVLGVLEPAAGGFSLRALAIADTPVGPVALPPLVGTPDPSTEAVEEAALRGRGGAILAGLAQEAGAGAIVRVARWPVGAVAMDGTIYVNGAWLVALGALEEVSEPGGMYDPAPGLVPRSIDGNPYDLPRSLNQCVADVQEQCGCVSSDQCQRPPIDPTFSDAKAECSWVDENPLNDDALCVLALLSVEQIKDCVADGDPPCTALPVTNKEQAQIFAADPICMAYLDSCLAGGEPSAPVTPPPTSSCSDDCDACDSPNCNTSNCDQCDRCDSSIGSCNDSCDSCNSSCDSCNDRCDNTGDNCKCEVVRPRRGPPDGGPWGSALWLLWPAVYIALRTGRRA